MRNLCTPPADAGLIRSAVMTGPPQRAAAIAAVAATCLAVAGCGQGSPAGSPAVSRVPLAPGTRIVSQVRRCDQGAHPFCAVELVLAAARGRYAGSTALLAGEAQDLHRAGWSAGQGDTTHESAAESPSHRLRVTYATAAEDLLSIDEGRITRAGPIALALSGEMFARAPALSVMVSPGTS